MHFGIDRRFGVDPWEIIESEYCPDKIADSQSIFSLANEYMGIRGMFEEGDLKHTNGSYEGCYINGIYVREKYEYIWKRKAMPDEANFIANTTNWLPIIIHVGDEKFSMDSSIISDYKRILDMKTGTLTRSLVFTTQTGLKTQIEYKRFISYDIKHCSAIRVTIKAIDHEVPVSVNCHLDGRTGNEIYVKQEKSGNVIVSECKDNEIMLLKNLPSTGQYFVTRSRVVTDFDSKLLVCDEDELNPGLSLKFIPEKDKVYTVDKLVATVSSRDCGYTHGLVSKGAENRDVEKSDEEKILKFLKQESADIVQNLQRVGFDELHQRHSKAVQKMWDHSDVEISGDPLSQQGLRYCMFQLNNTYRGFDPKLNIAAKGLTGEFYQGRHFWDTESYCLPYYLFTNPKAARNLVESRFHHLDNARNLAKEFNYKGAIYPWQTIDGSEECPIWEYTFGEIHINAIVPYAVYLYVNTTGDKEYLYKKGIEVVLETSRFWVDRSDYITYRKGYAINRVTGPDEYQQMTNNNYYTNYMAKSTLQYALEVIDEMKKNDPASLSDVYKKINFNESETDEWRKIIDGMILNVDDRLNIFVEDDMFLSLTPVYREDLDKDRDIPVESKWSIEKFQKAQIVKQPDVLLLFFLHPDRFTMEEKESNYRFYEQRTVHGSSLSPCIHSILANEIGRRNQAYEYFLWSSRLDLDDFNGNVKQGLHISAMSGTWLNVVFGFGGMRIGENSLSFSPTLPKSWTSYSFKLNYQGSVIKFSVDQKSVKASVVEGAGVNVNIYNKEYSLSLSEICIDIPHEIASSANLKGVIFDLDGVVTDTAKYHYLAWKSIADDEGIYFDEVINERLKGVSRSESLEVILERSRKEYSESEKTELLKIKNDRYVKMLDEISPKDILPGILDLLGELEENNIKTAICSASRNTDRILEKLGIRHRFDQIVTGNDVQKSKPDPEGMFLAAERIGIEPNHCVVIEDSYAGIKAARDAGMKSMGVGDKDELYNSDYTLRCTNHLNFEKLNMLF